MTPAVAAADIPEAIHRAYLRGAATVNLPSDPVTLPFSGTGWTGHYRSPYLQTFVNGHGPYTFIFDTGANVTVLSRKVARAAHVAVANHTPGHHAILRASEIRVGRVSMRDYYAVLSDNDLDEVDGILGFNSFGSNALTFDFATGFLRVATRPQALPNGYWMPYSMSHHLPMIQLRAAGKSLPTLIDTGDDAYAWEATRADLSGLLLDHTPVESAVVYNSQTGATRTAITMIDADLHLGPFVAERPVVAINPSLPLPDIGMRVIEQFAVEFDRSRHRVAFARRFPGANFVGPGEYTCGVYLSFAKPQRVVRDVLAGSAADKAGVRPGDTILAIEGRRGEAVTYEEWDRMLVPGHSVTVQWQRAGRTASGTFPVIELR
jgi:hypothetical protein